LVIGILNSLYRTAGIGLCSGGIAIAEMSVRQSVRPSSAWIVT